MCGFTGCSNPAATHPYLANRIQQHRDEAATAAAIAESVERPRGPSNSDDDVPDISQFDSEHCHSYLHYFETGHAYALEV